MVPDGAVFDGPYTLQSSYVRKPRRKRQCPPACAIDIENERQRYNDENRNVYKGALAVVGYDWARVLFLGSQDNVSAQNICDFSALSLACYNGLVNRRAGA